MRLGGKAAMVLYYDIAPDAIEDHDDWHTHEHFPERLSIPGFLRASRWVATAGGPRYLVIYEVANVGVLSGAPYLERLNDPTPWTARMMPNFRGMVRGFCAVASGAGQALGHALLSIRHRPAPGREAELRRWLAGDVLPGIAGRSGLASAHLLEPAAKPPMTKEQAIRGRDAEMPCVLLVTGYREDAVAHIASHELAAEKMAERGCSPESARGRYRLDLVAVAPAHDPELE
jgi:hypothetical protein